MQPENQLHQLVVFDRTQTTRLNVLLSVAIYYHRPYNRTSGSIELCETLQKQSFEGNKRNDWTCKLL